MSHREIHIANRHPRLRLDRRAVARVIHTLDGKFSDSGKSKIENRNSKMKSPPSGELSVVFLTDAALARLHADFLDDPSPTDVITFAADAAAGSAGEICVSADAARRQMRARGDFSAELTLYLVHGWLHLAGYDDLQPARKRQMRRAEVRAMRLLRREGARPKFCLRK